MGALHTRKEATRLYRDIVRAARHFPWPHESGRPWRVVLVESARAEFEQARELDDANEVMRRLVIGRHCLDETAKKFEEKRQSFLAQQAREPSDGGAPSSGPGRP
ncbi:hypothetical protein KFE25_006710 [Diacronema lutheri]|uniref:Complex 1 LYR protein domain-containing protein n=2 Tax=Diacronema lutheri TaxID=2081491 RepID=A0A8J5XHT7_DIALT|nr:hypothetical protein KFE25_006710 [Diacronema lutheri]